MASGPVQDIQDLTQKYLVEKDYLSTIFGTRKKEVLNGTLPFIIFAEGEPGQWLHDILQIHGCTADCFVDNNPALAGRHYNGTPIFGPEHLPSVAGKAIVISSQKHDQAIRAQIKAAGIAEEFVFSAKHPHCVYFNHFDRMNYLYKIFLANQEKIDLVARKQEISDAYESLGDQKSRDLFVRRIAAVNAGFSYGAFADFMTHCCEPLLDPSRAEANGNNYYFSNDLFQPVDGAVIVDAGAFTGDTVDAIVELDARFGTRYGKIISLEPDPANFSKLAEHTAQYRDVICHPVGSGESDSVAQFRAEGTMGSRYIDRPGTISVPIRALDGLLAGEPVTHIKLDVEGNEVATLRGAHRIISANRPKLSIAAYHKHDDILTIPNAIRQIDKDYRIYIRHYHTTFFETMIFAIPRHRP